MKRAILKKVQLHAVPTELTFIKEHSVTCYVFSFPNLVPGYVSQTSFHFLNGNNRGNLPKSDKDVPKYQPIQTLVDTEEAKPQALNVAKESNEVKADENELSFFNAEEIVQWVSSSGLDDAEKLFVNERLQALTFDSKFDKHDQDAIIKWLCDSIDFLDELKLFSSQ